MGKSPNYMVDFPAGIGLPDGIAEPTHWRNPAAVANDHQNHYKS
jgi:hypothetical protein